MGHSNSSEDTLTMKLLILAALVAVADAGLFGGGGYGGRGYSYGGYSYGGYRGKREAEPEADAALLYGRRSYGGYGYGGYSRYGGYGGYRGKREAEAALLYGRCSYGGYGYGATAAMVVMARGRLSLRPMPPYSMDVAAMVATDTEATDAATATAVRCRKEKKK